MVEDSRVSSSRILGKPVLPSDFPVVLDPVAHSLLVLLPIGVVLSKLANPFEELGLFLLFVLSNTVEVIWFYSDLKSLCGSNQCYECY